MHDRILKHWNATSLRTKITGVTVLMLTFGLVVSGIGTMTVLRSYLLNQLDAKLGTALEDPAKFLGPGVRSDGFTFEDIRAAPASYYVVLLNAAGEVMVTNKSALEESKLDFTGMDLLKTQALGGNVYSIREKDNQTVWHAVSIMVALDSSGTNGTLVVASPLAETENTTTTYLSIFLAFGIGVVILGAMLTRLLVTSTFAPLRKVEQTAAAIADGGDFSQRMAGDTPNTEVGRLNRSLNTMLSRIDRAFDDRARTIDQMRRFVGDASHELRTPLVSVRGYAELYRMGALQTPEDVSQAMDRIEKEAIRMGSLVEDLLELARLDETKPLNLTTVNLIPLAVDAAMDARASSPGRTISVSTSRSTDPVITFNPALEPILPETAQGETDSSTNANQTGSVPFSSAFARLRGRRSPRQAEPAPDASPQPSSVVPVSTTSSFELPDNETGPVPLVLAEENKIRQVLTNLIGNALRFTSADSPIELAVSVDEKKSLAVVDVIDHGDGIPPQIREKIFQRFWRADSSRTRETGGSGLGLAIVSSIIAAHGGTVRALETPGGGATFRVSLPLLTEPPHQKGSTGTVPVV